MIFTLFKIGVNDVLKYQIGVLHLQRFFTFNLISTNT